MGLLSVFGKAEADRRKAREHEEPPRDPLLDARPRVGEPRLPPDAQSEARVARWAASAGSPGPRGTGR